MKFTLSTAGDNHAFSAYGEGWVEIDGIRHTRSLIVGSRQAPQPWVADFEHLESESFGQLLAWKPEIVLFGSGRGFRFPHPSLTRALPEARVGLEVMDTFAACRTFNVLVGEGRLVVAALLID
jgi:uncharacterized protein